jgi:hypothetical protein
MLSKCKTGVGRSVDLVEVFPFLGGYLKGMFLLIGII